LGNPDRPPPPPAGDIRRRERDYPCRSTNLFSRTAPALRVLYDHRRFCVEALHCVSDGGGALTMAKALLARYLQLAEKDVPGACGLSDFAGRPQAGELADSRYYRVNSFFQKTSQTLSPLHVCSVRKHRHCTKTLAHQPFPGNR